MSTHLTSDVELWQNSLDGDDRAFASLFDRHKDRVFRHCVGMSGS
jgi:DNA-directed RNA polymerase specialized sigma24 family protein